MPRLRHLAAALLLASVGSAPFAESDVVEPCVDPSAMQHWVEQINAQRAAGAACAPAVPDAQQLEWDPRLAATALAQATDLALRDTLSHRDARQRTLKERLQASGYPLRVAGENLAAGQSQFEGALSAWLASAGHCANLMQPQYSDVGLACVQRRGSRYERFWVAHLGTPARR